MRNFKLLLLILVICGLVGVYAYWFYVLDQTETELEEEIHHHENEEEVSMTRRQIRQAGIEIDKAGPGIVQKVIRAPGRIIVHPDKFVHIVPNVSGVVIEARKNLGDTVNADEELAILESREMAESKSAYLAAMKKEKISATRYEREKNLHEKKISSLQDYLEAETEQDESKIELELCKQRLHAIGLTEDEILQIPNEHPETLGQYSMRTPIQGTIMERHLSLGERIDQSHESYQVANLNNVWVEVTVFQQDLPLLRKGQYVTVASHDGTLNRARLTNISPRINEETRKGTAIARMKNKNGKWPPGQYVTVEINADPIRVPILVTKEAIQKVHGHPVVFVYQDEGFDIRPVKLGRTDKNNVEIIGGLVPGEAYASTNTFLIKAEHEKEEAEHSHSH